MATTTRAVDPAHREAGGAPGLPTLSVLLLGSTLTVMAGALLSPVLALIRDDLLVSDTAAGLILTVHGLTIALASPATGWLIDRFGVRSTLAAGLVLYGIAGGAGLAGIPYSALLVSRLVFGIGAAAVFTGTTVALLSLYTGSQRDRVMGWRGTAISLGGLVWPLLGGALGALSWRAPFGVYLLGVPLGLAALLLLPGSRPVEAPQVRGDGALAQLRRRPVIVGYYALFAVGAVLLYAVLVFLPLRLSEVGVDDPLLVAVYSSGLSATMSLVGLVYGRVRTTLGYRGLLRAAYTSFVAAFLLLGTSDQVALLALAAAVLGVGMGISIPALTVLTADAAPASVRGQITSLLATATFLGQFASPLLLGPLVDATSVSTGFLAAGATSGIVLMVLLLARGTRPPDL